LRYEWLTAHIELRVEYQADAEAGALLLSQKALFNRNHDVGEDKLKRGALPASSTIIRDLLIIIEIQCDKLPALGSATAIQFTSNRNFEFTQVSLSSASSLIAFAISSAQGRGPSALGHVGKQSC
jgi:hypothetical protein